MDLLPAETVRHVAGFLDVRDLKAISITCKFTSRMVHSKNSSLWKNQFLRRWGRLNFVLDPAVPLILSPLLLRQCETESACYRLLTHMVQRLPSYANLDHTHQVAHFLPQHRFRTLEHSRGRSNAPVKIAFDSTLMGGDRCVRSNAPFSTSPHAFIHRCRMSVMKDEYHVGISGNGYFEITIGDPLPVEPASTPELERRRTILSFLQGHNNCVAIGVADRSFRVVGNQPGWRGLSFGYHGDDGNAFHQSTRGEVYGPTFGAGDTVGCALVDAGSTLVFTINGKMAGPPIPCRTSYPLFPVVGIDAPHVVSWNFGDRPFTYDAESVYMNLLVDSFEWEEASDVTDDAASHSGSSEVEDYDEEFAMEYVLAVDYDDEEDDEWIPEYDYDDEEEDSDVDDEDMDEMAEEVPLLPLVPASASGRTT
ncbi:Aste57867_633 [Aphanomyces stellatus]|uniref:Aste57867_633 protein n=1 Tax=Aphanomyces stellatus TaxID=120398 RepID=A0A485K6C5_9STRA|nr:hypothetical protein As57867_000632 [Aphanomyces stellatus]VFT77858.1 Aste57867_633 [Aphanomyces stellatus]